MNATAFVSPALTTPLQYTIRVKKTLFTKRKSWILSLAFVSPVIIIVLKKQSCFKGFAALRGLCMMSGPVLTSFV